MPTTYTVHARRNGVPVVTIVTREEMERIVAQWVKK